MKFFQGDDIPFTLDLPIENEYGVISFNEFTSVILHASSGLVKAKFSMKVLDGHTLLTQESSTRLSGIIPTSITKLMLGKLTFELLTERGSLNSVIEILNDGDGYGIFQSTVKINAS